MQDRRSRLAAPILALVAAVSIWLSAGTVAVLDGDTHRIAALPAFWILGVLAAAALGAARALRLQRDEALPLLISLVIWLPYLPMPVPAWFLIWNGPIEGFVWLAVIAGLLLARPPAIPDFLINRGLAPTVAATVLAIAAWVVFARIPDVIPGGDEPHYLAATQSLIQDLDLKVANNYAQGDYLDYFPGRLEPHFLKRSAGGEIYSIHAPGVSVIVLPAFALAGYEGAVALTILLAALAAWLTWQLAFRVSESAGGAWAGAASVFATAPYFFHTFTIYPEVIGSLSVLSGAWVLLDLSERRAVSMRMLIGSGTALAILPWLHTRFAVLAGLLGMFIAARLAQQAGGPRRLAAFLSVPVIFGAAWFAYFYLIWGSASPTAPYGADTSTSAAYVLRGLIGLAFDQQFGVLTTAPIYAVAIAGLVPMWRRQPRLTIELALTVAAYAVTVASYAMWWAGSAAPGRFLVAILPLAALPIAAVWVGPARRWPALWLLVISVGLIVPRAFVEGGRFIYNNRSGIDATVQWLASSVDLPLALPSVHRDGGAVAARDGLVWLMLAGGAAWLVAAARRAPAVKWTLLVSTSAAAVMASAAASWSLHASPVVAADRSKLAAAAAFRPAWHGLVFDVTGHRRLSAADFLGAMTLTIEAPTARLNRLPAGDYGLEPGGRGTTLALAVGRNDAAFDSLTLDGTGRLRLPVSLQTLHLAMSGALPDHAPPLVITPLAVRRPAADRYALRGARYGHARAFFFDDQAYPERDGFWTRAGGEAEVVLDTDDDARLSGLPLTVIAGAVDTTVDVAVGSWSQSIALAAGQKRELMLPPAEDRAWRVVIRSGAGFRPSEREPGNRDVRSLAAWIAIQ
jgi:hypothetical protein